MEYRPNATKIVCVITDAPPHGLEGDDGFAEGTTPLRKTNLISSFIGCPCGHDPLEVARVLAEKGIILYSLGVEPAIYSTKFLLEFLHAIARITEGQFIPMNDSKALK